MPLHLARLRVGLAVFSAAAAALRAIALGNAPDGCVTMNQAAWNRGFGKLSLSVGLSAVSWETSLGLLPSSSGILSPVFFLCVMGGFISTYKCK
jgi:hypothetical protein